MVARATGVEPYTSPPWTSKRFDPQVMEGYDLLYFRLHQAQAIQGVWLGERDDGEWIPALRVEQLEGLDLGSCIVVIANCWGVEGPFVPAFYQAGAAVVIAAPGPNFGASNAVVGADLLVQWIIRGLRWGFSVRRALAMAKVRLLATAWRGTDRDALAFQIMEVDKA